MVKEKGKWKNFFSKENMIVLVLLGILLLVIAIPVEQKEKDRNSESVLLDLQDDIIDSSEKSLKDSQENALEQRLASFLSYMDGAGEVKVMITFSSSEEQIVEKDVSTTGIWEQASGNSVPGNETTVFQTDREGTQSPYVKKTLAASVEGVTVLAQGGDLPEIQNQITMMIEALFGIEAHKIRVGKMK